ncbi:UNVERIFIED_CONTAM: hypothetical protein Sradi_0892400 [Sesamum radiatum]|uniref:Uncharacterized protein n=1 Tax=Sesamum radiatum TaxID=300843 RepID=A0AAW2V2K7_SESRA
MHRMKELYVVPNQYIRYAVKKTFFSVRMIRGSSVWEHRMMMLSVVEKLNDLQVDLENEEKYVDVILQSLPPSFDQFIINYNMNRLEKNLYDLINMLVQYEATIEKSAPWGKGKGRGFVNQGFQMMFASIAEKRAIRKGIVLNFFR